MKSSYLRTFLCVLAAAAIAYAAPARSTDYTDVWWTPSEPGWGLNVTQADNFIYVYFFIYGPDRKPLWYSAQLSQSGTRFTGNLYSTQGTYFAQPWNPADNPGPVQVGTATFAPSDQYAYQATLSYTVTGVGTVSKVIERATLNTIPLGGSYVGGQSGAYSSCSNASDNYSYVDTYTLEATQTTGGRLTLVFSNTNDLTCTLSGTLEQRGSLFRMPGATYACAQNGAPQFSTTATVFEMRATPLGIEGRLAAQKVSGGCAENAQFSAVLQ